MNMVILDTDYFKACGERIRLYREKNDISQEALAKNLEIDIRCLRRYENGSIPPGHVIVGLVMLSGISADWWLGLNEKINEEDKRARNAMIILNKINSALETRVSLTK